MIDIRKAELIGLPLEIEDSENKSLMGLKGTIIDETKNTFTIRTDEGDKKIMKDQVKVLVRKNSKIYRVDGRVLSKRPEERIKTR